MEEKKISFREVEVTEIDGTVNKVDLNQRIAQELYAQAHDLPAVLAAQDLYRNGECIPKPEDYDLVVSTIRQLISQFGYVLRTSIEKCLD